MNKEDKLIEYRYLNMDRKCFVKDQVELIKTTGKGALVRAIPNYQFNQCLIASGSEWFSEYQAIALCRSLLHVLEA